MRVLVNPRAWKNSGNSADEPIRNDKDFCPSFGGFPAKTEVTPSEIDNVVCGKLTESIRRHIDKLGSINHCDASIGGHDVEINTLIGVLPLRRHP